MSHKYYFKIKKGEAELEFSTDNLDDFDKKVSLWVDEICANDSSESGTPKRKGFIDLKKLTTLKEKTEIQQDVNVDFDELLGKTIQNPKLDLEKKVSDENELLNLIKEKHPRNKLCLMILTAFYMLQVENIQHFTLKQVNSRLVPLKKEPVTSIEIEAAIADDLIQIVPDLTGMSDVTEYCVTQKGEEFYFNDI